ncbi:hypothetical protein NUW54_g11916 [Trametes sanguinea]|uniref:Uncharacterized protein n=1 Tax=Trametes sanguinea TaxID=158606 RepID=A0ACC1N5Z2_9APHY|nr:hypothetical protein NUW54_g11916 [Trametes sanguinea]
MFRLLARPLRSPSFVPALRRTMAATPDYVRRPFPAGVLDGLQVLTHGPPVCVQNKVLYAPLAEIDPEVVLPLTKRKRSACSSGEDVSEVSKADGGVGLKQKQSVEGFGTPYLLLGLPPSRDEPEEIGDRRESQITAAGKLANAIDAFLNMDRLKRPFGPERMRAYKECYSALHRALKEVEAQEDTLAREEITQAGLVGALKELADANDQGGQLKASSKAAMLLAHFTARFPGLNA